MTETLRHGIGIQLALSSACEYKSTVRRSNAMTTWSRVVRPIGLAAVCCLLLGGAATPTRAAQDWDNDATWREVRNFDRFLDTHHEVAEEVWRHPNVVRKEKWCYRHPEFEEWMRDHPRAAEELRENPRGFMNRVRDLERHERGEGYHRDWC